MSELRLRPIVVVGDHGLIFYDGEVQSFERRRRQIQPSVLSYLSVQIFKHQHTDATAH